MDLTEFIKVIFAQYGAAALPWSVVVFLVWLVWGDRKSKGAVPHEYQILLDHYHEGMMDVTRALERLAVLIEERTRRQSR